MKNNNTRILLAAISAAAVAVSLTGCGQARGTGEGRQTDAPVIRVTEAPVITEAPVTEAPQTETEPQTQAPQTETQPQTQSETQPQTAAAPLSKEEEIAQETEYEQSKTMYAADDVNVREFPTTDEENIFWSLDQGQTATVIGETPNWYEISVPTTDENGNADQTVGFVSKQFMSDTQVQAKTDEERAAEAAGETAQTTAPAAETSAPVQQAQPAATTPASGPSVTMGADANIRSGASQTSDVVGTVSAGEKVTVIGDADGWYQVDYNGVQGYVNKNLVG